MVSCAVEAGFEVSQTVPGSLFDLTENDFSTMNGGDDWFGLLVRL